MPTNFDRLLCEFTLTNDVSTTWLQAFAEFIGRRLMAAAT